jgi:hypothetical protein
MNESQQQQYEMMLKYSPTIARRYKKFVTSKDYLESFAKQLERSRSNRKRKRLN